MVTVTSYHLRESKDKKPFISLVLQGDLELVQSMQTGKFYATARKCSISSTFEEATAKALVGKQIAGSIVRVECEPYDYAIPESGEIIQLAHSYEYRPDEVQVAQREKQMAYGANRAVLFELPFFINLKNDHHAITKSRKETS
jgi:hypothetical protein